MVKVVVFLLVCLLLETFTVFLKTSVKVGVLATIVRIVESFLENPQAGPSWHGCIGR